MHADAGRKLRELNEAREAVALAVHQIDEEASAAAAAFRNEVHAALLRGCRVHIKEGRWIIEQPGSFQS
jgi:hypothetical protein